MTAAVKTDLLRAANELRQQAAKETELERRRELATKAASYFREIGWEVFAQKMELLTK
jgi:hypothetical protein